MFSSVRALSGLLLPGRLSTVPLSRSLINRLLTPRFVQLFSGNSSVNHFVSTASNTNIYQNFVLSVDKHCSDVCCDEFLVPQIDRKNK